MSLSLSYKAILRVALLTIFLSPISATMAIADDTQWSADQVVYRPREMLSFSTKQYLRQHAKHLVAQAELIDHIAGETSISPRLLLALMEYQSGIVSDKKASQRQLAAPFGPLSTRYGFREQLDDIAQRLFVAVYQTPQQQLLKANNAAVDAQTALTAVQQLLAKTSSLQASQLSRDLFAVYDKLFPNVRARKASVTELSALAPPTNLLQLAWPLYESWVSGGAHTTTGSGNYPLSSLDFNDGGYWGDNLSNKWVVAAAVGTVKVHSSCNVEVIHSDGWSTQYYHLQNVQVSSNQTVNRNTRLANYASNKSQALCQGGSSSGPHVHFTVKYNGQPYHLSDVVLSGYKVHPGRSSYDDNCSYFWFENNGRKYCAWTDMYNSDVVVDTPRESEPNNTMAQANLLVRQQQTYGTLSSSSDSDYFKVVLTAPSTLNVVLTPNSNADYDLYLFNSSGALIGKSEKSTGLVDSISYSAAAATYYMQVKYYSGATSTTNFMYNVKASW